MADYTALPLTVLAEQFAKLPGIGMKTAKRLAYHVTTMSNSDVQEFSNALINVKCNIHLCDICQNFTDGVTCPLCSDHNRDGSIVCVVETPQDIAIFEKSGDFNGLYHVLHGLISPLGKVMPQDLKVSELLKRVQSGTVKEVIMATNSTVEGDATAIYIANLLKPLGVKVTRLAFGIPVGSYIEYVDDVTINKALENRNEM
ncbi:MAG: recombination mediator RecR [Ruminococcus sp.]|nr:recombination mediator RecR [Ruminococcus sp.]MCD7800449.1 recombination mediator RecR [Ruminococcus sp.]